MLLKADRQDLSHGLGFLFSILPAGLLAIFLPSVSERRPPLHGHPRFKTDRVQNCWFYQMENASVSISSCQADPPDGWCCFFLPSLHGWDSLRPAMAAETAQTDNPEVAARTLRRKDICDFSDFVNREEAARSWDLMYVSGWVLNILDVI